MTWNKIAKRGMPKVESGHYWCWADGYAKPVVLEFRPDLSRERPWRGGVGGAQEHADVTHWRPLDKPAAPTG